VQPAPLISCTFGVTKERKRKKRKSPIEKVYLASSGIELGALAYEAGRLPQINTISSDDMDIIHIHDAYIMLMRASQSVFPSVKK
jgi:hypothetical protein